MTTRTSRPRRWALAWLAVLYATVGTGVQAQNRDEPVVTLITDVALLAEIIGGAHFLRRLCEGGSDQMWRDQMIRLLDIEAMDDAARHGRLIEAFNDGYRDQERRFSACTSQVRQEEARLAGEGRRLAERLTDRYLD